MRLQTSCTCAIEPKDCLAGQNLKSCSNTVCAAAVYGRDRQLNTQNHTLNQNSLGPFGGYFGNCIKQKKKEKKKTHLFDNKTYGPMTYASPEP